MVTKIQFAIEPLAPSTTQNTPRMAAVAAIQAFTSEKFPLSTNEVTDNASIAHNKLTSNQFSDLKVSLSNVVYFFSILIAARDEYAAG